MKRNTRKSILLATFIISSYIILALTTLTPQASTNGETVELLSLDFSDEVEALKHLDTTTENYDSGNDGSSREYVDTTNQWFVFEGDNTDTSQGFDEPIAVVKGYGEVNGFDSYAVLPYNYTVDVDFYVPSSPGYGNFYVFPRYKTVADKYEVVIDTEWNNLVFNYVKNNSWHNLKTVYFGSTFTIQKDHWYHLRVTIFWEYNSTAGKYMNHIIATVSDPSSPGSSFTDDVWDDNLEPASYNGLAFLGFDDNKQFKVYMDNIEIWSVRDSEKVLSEPRESITPGDLNLVNLSVAYDPSMLYFRLVVNESIAADASNTKYWVLQLDLDRDSRSGSSWDWEYQVIMQIDSAGTPNAGLYDSSGNWIKKVHVLGGGIGYDYFVVEVNRSDLTGLGEALYLYGYTQLGGTVEDAYPRDDVDYNAGDYAIYYLDKPSPSSPWTTITDDSGDATPASLDILYAGSAYTSSLMFFNITLNGPIAWNGGDDTGIYRIYIDADNNPSTGYSKGGIGVDYMLEHVVGFVPKLYQYTGDGATWSWTLLSREDYVRNPGESTIAVYVVPKSDFTGTPLASQVSILAETGQGSSVVDSTAPQVVPVPEYGLAVALSVLAVAVITIAWFRRRGGG
ncbi:MAG: hypothetical protein GSR73_03050 [Desulfurococcales archaeon]|nr:hypothetical protein [Desulfurococcales archaeon]